MALTVLAGTSAASKEIMTTHQPPALHAVAPYREGTAGETWAALDAELARWLSLRTSLRGRRARETSSLDGMAMALRRVRATLDAMGERASVAAGKDPTIANLVSRAYRWAIRMARELEAIEQLELDPIKEWTRFEAFAPFARAFFESALAAPFAAATQTPNVARLQREIDGVMAPISIAMMSSACAA